MNKKIFIIILLVTFLAPSISYAAGCTMRVNPCPPDSPPPYDNGVYGEIEKKHEGPKGPDDYYLTDTNKNGYREMEICEFKHIFALMNNIIVYIMTCLAPILAGIMLIFGGFYFMVAGVDPEKISRAKQFLTGAVVGLVIIFVSWVLLNTFLTSMGVAEWTGLETWWEFNIY